MGVFYHLRYPLLALDLLASRTRRLMMFQTLTMPGDTVYPDTAGPPDRAIASRCSSPAGRRWPSSSIASPATRPTGGSPTTPAVEAMLRSAGLRVKSRPAGEIYLCEPQGAGAGDGGGDVSADDATLQAALGALPSEPR